MKPESFQVFCEAINRAIPSESALKVLSMPLPDRWPASLTDAIALHIQKHVRDGNVTMAATEAARVAFAIFGQVVYGEEKAGERAWQGLEDALIAWLEDCETLPGMKEYNGPLTTATDKLIGLAREVRRMRDEKEKTEG